MLESQIEKEVCKYANDLGYLTYKFVSPNNRGVPDRIFMKNGRCFFIEFKQKDKKPTKIQEKTILKMKSYKMLCFIVDSVERGKVVISSIESSLNVR